MQPRRPSWAGPDQFPFHREMNSSNALVLYWVVALLHRRATSAPFRLFIEPTLPFIEAVTGVTPDKAASRRPRRGRTLSFLWE